MAVKSGQGKEMSYTESGKAMGTFLQVTEYGARHANAFAAVREAFDRMEAKCSPFLPDSELSLVNRRSGKSPVAVSDEFLRLLRYALREADFTGGIFDPTIGAVTSAWNDGEALHFLSASELAKRMKLVDWRRTEIAGQAVALRGSGMALDLGGIAREFTLHWAADKARCCGMASGIINIGGDVAVIGQKPDGTPWRVGIPHPRKRGELLATIPLRDCDTMETSSDRRQSIEADGVVQSHIFSGLCGGDEPLMSATLIYKRGDALPPCGGAALVAAGLAKSCGFLRKIPGMQAVLVTQAREVFVTGGLRWGIRLSDREYKIRPLELG